MLRRISSLSETDGAELMAVYRESNRENAAWFAPGAPTPEEGLRRTEAGFLTWLREEFLPLEENALWVWEENGIPLSALRLTQMEGFLWLEALETRPDRRGQGYGERLLHALETELARRGGASIRSCVSRANIPSLALHRKAGFTVERSPGWDYGTGEEDNGSLGLRWDIPKSEERRKTSGPQGPDTSG